MKLRTYKLTNLQTIMANKNTLFERSVEKLCKLFACILKRPSLMCNDGNKIFLCLSKLLRNILFPRITLFLIFLLFYILTYYFQVQCHALDYLVHKYNMKILYILVDQVAYILFLYLHKSTICVLYI